ncbi:AAA family ATPase, partial [Angustibacter aerolatus]
MTDPAEQPPEPTRDRLVADAVRGWQAVGTDPLLRFRDLPSGTLDLTHAHPSGLAMLFAGRPTRLSGLVREPGSLADARRRARAVRARTLELSERHGIAAGWLAVGTATWDVADAHASAAPVLLRPCVLRPRGSAGEDYDVDLAGAAVLNPALVRHLADDHGIELDADAVAALAVTDEGFDPAPVLAHVERTCQGLPGLRVEHRLVIGTFADVVAPVVHDLQRLGPRLAAHDVVAALAGDASAREALQRPAPEPAGDRDPASEHLVLDLDASQQDVVEAVLAGGHRVVEAPAGTGGTQLVAALAAALAADGRRTLVVAEQRVALDRVLQRLSAIGLDGAVLDLRDGAGA